MIPGNANPLLLASATAAAAADTEFSIQKSVRFNDDDSAHFTRTPSSASNRRTFTWSGWFKRSTIDGTHTLFAAGSDQNNRFALRFSSGQLFIVDQVGGGSIIRNRTEQQFRDVSSWYHFVIAIDSTQSTSSDRLKMYVNGSVVEDYDITNYPSQNQQFNVNSTDEHYIGKRVAETQYFDGYMANVHFIDGLGLAASDFGFYDDNNVWRPKNYSGTYGTNGFHLLDFANESTLGHDSSGNNNDWTANNFSTSGGATDVLFDSPTNGDQSDTGAGGEVSGNYCTLNPLDQRDGTLSNGNLDYDLGSGTKFVSGTIAVKSGKWFWEAKAVSGVTNGSVGGRFGLSQAPTERHGENGPFTLFWHATGGIKTAISGTITSRATGTNYADSDILGLALDADANIAYFYKNGSLAYTYDFSSLVPAGSQFLTPSCWNGSSGTPKWKYNFGQRAFAHSARTNHKCLVSTNLPTPTIADGRDYFDAKLWTGNSTDQRAITGYQFSPDWVWIKRRNASYAHPVMDTVRGLNSGHAGVLYTNQTNAEDTGPTSSIRSFNSDGFNLGTDGGVNYNGSTYVGWAWDAGSSTVSNTDGSITTSIRASAASGFSIVTYTGNGTDNATFGHGLNAAPEYIIAKRRDSADDWFVYSLPTAGNILKLNATDAKGSSSHFRTMSSSTFQLSGNPDVNANNGTFVAYCISPVAGYSAVGEYEGNGSTDGPFIHTGFRVAFLLLKCHTATELWMMHDSTRDPENVVSKLLQPHTTDAEIDSASNYGVDFLSNGFKFRSSSNRNNGSGKSYVYLAFAENPFQANGGLAR